MTDREQLNAILRGVAIATGFRGKLGGRVGGPVGAGLETSLRAVASRVVEVR